MNPLHLSTARQTTAADFKGTLHAMAQPVTASHGLVAKFAGMTDGCIVDRPHWLVFEGQAEIGYVSEISGPFACFEWRVGDDLGSEDTLAECLPEMAAALGKQREDAAATAKRSADVEALQEPLRGVTKQAMQAELDYQVAITRNVQNDVEVADKRLLRDAWAKAQTAVEFAASASRELA